MLLTTTVCSDGYDAHLLDAHRSLIDDTSHRIRLPASNTTVFQSRKSSSELQARESGLAKSQADKDNEEYHASIREWLGHAVQAVRHAWIEHKTRKVDGWNSTPDLIDSDRRDDAKRLQLASWADTVGQREHNRKPSECSLLQDVCSLILHSAVSACCVTASYFGSAR